jgi:hypothetical protein
MKYLIIRHPVADFARWKPHYDAHAGARDAAGLVEKELLHDVNDPNHLVLLFEANDLAKAKELVESDSIKEAMREGGVIGKPEFFFLQS